MIEARTAPAAMSATTATNGVSARSSRPAWLSDALGVLACCAASVLILAPLVSGGMISTHDGFLHVQRLIALEAAAREGVLLPRWLPDLAYGYGAPLFLYYASIAYLPALAVRLLGGGYVGSVAASGGLALILSGLTMYLLARSLVGPIAATVAGIVYASLPYQIVDLYVRGALAETWAFVWLPLAAWCLLRARQDGSRRWSVGMALALAGLILTHNVTAFLFAPALVVLGALLRLHAPHGAPSWQRPAIGLLFGLGLSAWFWLPAIAEKGLVQLSEIVEPDLFASFFMKSFPPFRLDLLYDYREPASTALGYPIFWPQLGLVQAILSILGAVAALPASGLRLRVMVWATLLIVGGVALQLGPAARLYDLVPLLGFIQFPWRLLAIVGLGSALLSGMLVEQVGSRANVRLAVAGLAIAASLVTGLGRLEPERSPIAERYLAADTSFRTELADYGLGTTHGGEYLPANSGQRNAARFRKALIDEPAPSPANAGTSSLQVSDVDWRAGSIRVTVQASAPDRLVLHQFAFPGWTARLDGMPAMTLAVAPFGLLALDVPVGKHAVEFVWGQTTLRLVAVGITIASLVGLVLSVVGGVPRGDWRRRLGLALGIITIVVALATAFGDPFPPLPITAPSVGPQQSIGDQLALTRSTIDTSRLTSDGVLTVDLTWFVREAPRAGYRARISVTSATGAAQTAVWAYETPSRHWQRGELVRTTTSIRLPRGFPAGPAGLSLSFEQPARLGAVELGQIVVSAPGDRGMATTERSGAVPVVPGLDVVPGPVRPVASWIGSLVASPTARSGGAVDADLTWRATTTAPDLAHEYVTVVALRAPTGDVTSEPARPGQWFNPLPFWQAGDQVDQRVRLWLPPGLAPGQYPLIARIHARDLAGGGMEAPGAAASRPRGRPVAEVSLGDLTVEP